MRSKLLMVAAGILTAMTIGMMPMMTPAVHAGEIQSREQAVNSIADWFLGNLHPELNGRKLRSDETDYIQEWQTIHTILEQEGLEYSEGSRVIAGGWFFSNRNQVVIDRITDAIFFSRHPERNRTKIQPNDQEAIQEWQTIRKAIRVPAC